MSRAPVRRLRRAFLLLWLAALAVVSFSSARAGASERNLVRARGPAFVRDVERAEVLTDGVEARPGSEWRSNLSAVLENRNSTIQYDLGAPIEIDSVYLQADNDDSYVVAASMDGREFREIWVAKPVSAAGLRARFASGLGASGRFVRVSARGGDGSYAISELQLFSARPRSFPPVVPTRQHTDPALRIRNATLQFGFALALLAAFATRTAPWFWLLVLGAMPILAGVPLVRAILDGWPLQSRELALVRATLAAVALVALVRERLGGVLPQVHRGVHLATLAFCALASSASFYNFGRPQFWNATEERPEFVHAHDMRVYQPFTRYFEELGYDGVYQASIAAHVEDVPGASLRALHNVEIRDLRTHELERVSDVEHEIRTISGRFSPDRWQSFKRDMSYFRATMGERLYLATHNDHGANATPVWVLLAHPWLALPAASEATLVVGGLLDPLLLALMFAAVGRTFGVRQMLLGILIFGATNLSMFGSNWAGATLRHDWIAFLGLGFCALKRRYLTLAGALLGLAAAIRVFPGIALVGVGLPCVAAFAERWYRERRPPDLRAHLAEHRAALHVILAGLAMIAACVLVTGVVFSFGAWADWWRKVGLLDSSIGMNHVSLRGLLASGAGGSSAAALRARMPLYLALFALFFACAVLAARRLSLHRAAVLALPLAVIVFNPANYYVHFIALLPLLAGETASGDGASEGAERSRALSDLAVSGPLLVLCVAEYWTTLDTDLARHFQYETVLTLSVFGWIYVNVLRHTYASGVTAQREQMLNQ